MRLKQNDVNEKFLPVIVIGDAKVGKTSLIRKALKKEFKEEYKETFGFDIYNMGVKLDNKIIYLEVIDMSFTEESKNFILQSIFEASAAILVYNIGNSLTFQGINVWLERIKKHFPCEKMILVGNQTDLDDVQIENEEKKDENDDLFEDLFGDDFEKKET